MTKHLTYKKEKEPLFLKTYTIKNVNFLGTQADMARNKLDSLSSKSLNCRLKVFVIMICFLNIKKYQNVCLSPRSLVSVMLYQRNVRRGDSALHSILWK